MQREHSSMAVAAAAAILGSLAHAQIQAPLHTVNGAVAGDRSGWSVAGAGDVLGNGGSEYLIGELLSGTNAGSVRVVDATGTTIATFSGATEDRVGASVTGMGLWTTDAFADFAVGAVQGQFFGLGIPRPNGFVDLYRGAAIAGGIATVVRISAGLTPNGENPEAFGFALDGNGEANGDGVPDLLVGSRYGGVTPQINLGPGRVYLYSGAVLRNSAGTLSHNSGSHLLQIFDNEFEGTPSGANQFGHAVSFLADITGDGRDEIAVGAPYFGPLGWEGKVYVYSWSSTAGAYALLYSYTGAPGSQLGYSLDDAGDLDGDGLHDLVVGAPGEATSGGFDIGVVRALSGAYIATGTGTEVLWTKAGDSSYDPSVSPAPNAMHFGSAVAGLGDVNGDGRPDVAAGAPNADAYGPDMNPAINAWPGSIATGGSGVGMVRLISGDDAATLVEWFGPLGQNSAYGFAIAAAGDLDGNGGGDVLVGAPLANAQVGQTFAYSDAYTFGMTYGTAAPNSTGVPSQIGATGSQSLSANQLRLTCRNLPPNQNGIFFYGFSTAGGPIYVGGPIYRINTVLGTGASGTVALDLDFNAVPAMIGAMQRVYFQFWHRDIGGTTGLSDAINLGILP